MRPSTPSTRSSPLPPVAEDPATPSYDIATAQTSRIVHTHPSTGPRVGATGRTITATAENKVPSSPRLDLSIAQVSLVVELMAYSLMGTAKTGTMFTVYTALGSLAAGFTPAVQSLALGIYAGRGGEETGKLFGGLSVVQILGYDLFVSHCRYVSFR
jgi:hypothetical protein